MAEVKILIKGYTSADSPAGEETTCPTMALIKDKKMVILTDPGVLEDQNILINKLKEEGLGTGDIDIVFITHSHPDHYRNVGMFPRAKMLEYYGLWDRDRCDDWPEQLSDDIKIIKTPGHSYDSLSMLVKSGDGVVAICGDVFWKENYPADDPYASDKKELAESREKILKVADFIIPGHGEIYRVMKLDS